MASSPAHVLMTEFCNALAYEKDTCHGFGCWFMAFKYKVESNSDKPPDKNMMPAVSGGTLELSIFKVYSATSLALDFFGQSAPGATMDGFKSMRSKKNFCKLETKDLSRFENDEDPSSVPTDRVSNNGNQEMIVSQ